MKSSKNFIIELLQLAIIRKDISTIEHINDIYAKAQDYGINDSLLDSEGMVDFTSYLLRAIDSNISTDKLLRELGKINNEPNKTKSYYDISYLI